jgi:hypothetical protein
VATSSTSAAHVKCRQQVYPLSKLWFLWVPLWFRESQSERVLNFPRRLFQPLPHAKAR